MHSDAMTGHVDKVVFNGCSPRNRTYDGAVAASPWGSALARETRGTGDSGLSRPRLGGTDAARHVAGVSVWMVWAGVYAAVASGVAVWAAAEAERPTGRIVSLALTWPLLLVAVIATVGDDSRS